MRDVRCPTCGVGVDPLLAPMRVIGGQVVAVCGGCVSGVGAVAASAPARATDTATATVSEPVSVSVPVSVSAAPSARKSVVVALAIGAGAMVVGGTWAIKTGPATGMSTAAVSFDLVDQARGFAVAKLAPQVTIPPEPKRVVSGPKPFGSDWVYPLPGIKKWKLTRLGSFGARRPGRRPRECRRGHCGVDLHGPRGMPVVAIRPGTVVVVKRSRRGRSGRMVRIRHDNGMVSSYMHLDRVAKGLRRKQRVVAGQTLGTLGRTGIRKSPAHLHFSVAWLRNRRRHYFDPAGALQRALVIGAPISPPATRVASP